MSDRCDLCGLRTPAGCERPLHHVGCGAGAPQATPKAPALVEAGPEWDYEPLDLNDANDWQVEP